MQDGSPRVLLGVTGSIAAYKAVELVRLLAKAGVSVQVAMTRGATAFVRPLTFEAVSQNRVLTEVLEHGDDGIQHVERAHEIDLVLVAPASANTLARLRAGMADDQLSAIALATRAKKAFAPAMEPGMWRNPATLENVATLESRGWTRIGPDSGALASGRSGEGRMVEPAVLFEHALRLVGPNDLSGRHVLVTAGPTWEPLDPVRILTNRSTGAMGISIAAAAARRGARVTLVLGPTHLSPPNHPLVTTHRVESATEMLAAAERAAPVDVLIGTAAVSDFRPKSASASKLKREHDGSDRLELVENPDVLKTLAAAWPDTLVVGFAAETEDVVDNAKKKLARKGAKLIIGNVVGPDAGFGAGETSVIAVRADSETPFGPASKPAVADFVLDQVVSLVEGSSA